MQPVPATPSGGATLRPLGIGDVLDRVFGIYRARAIGLFVLGLIFFAALVIAWIVLSVGFALAGLSTFQRLSQQPTSDPATLLANPAFVELVGALFLFFAVGWLVTLLVAAVFTGAVIDAAAASHLGQERSLTQSLGVGLRASLRIFFAGVLATIAVSLIGVVFNVVSGFFVDNGLLLFLIFCVYFFVQIYVQASWFVSPVVATIEGHGPVSSLRRSWQLSTGFRWRIVGLVLLLVVLFMVLFVLVVVLIGLIATANQSAGAVAFFIAIFAAVPIWMPLFFGTMTVLYYDLRVRKEALDLQLAAEAMPRA
ncbi:MAG: hypothetical protein ACRDG6_03825 [Candidatus Limnocylindria bacterium]